MKWLNYKKSNLKQGSIARTESGEFVMVGEINISLGTNDEFTEDITHYTEYFCDDILSKIKYAELIFNRQKYKK